MAPMANGKICYVEIPATDIAVSARFYENVFGWNIRQRGDGARAFDDAVGEVSGTWVLNRPPATEPGLLLYIMVKSVSAACDAVIRNGSPPPMWECLLFSASPRSCFFQCCSSAQADFENHRQRRLPGRVAGISPASSCWRSLPSDSRPPTENGWPSRSTARGMRAPAARAISCHSAESMSTSLTCKS